MCVHSNSNHVGSPSFNCNKFYITLPLFLLETHPAAIFISHRLILLEHIRRAIPISIDLSSKISSIIIGTSTPLTFKIQMVLLALAIVPILLLSVSADLSFQQATTSSSSSSSSSSSATRAFRGSSNINTTSTENDMEMPVGVREFTDIVFLAKMEQPYWYDQLNRGHNQDVDSMSRPESAKAMHDVSLALAVSVSVNSLVNSSVCLYHTLPSMNYYIQTVIAKLELTPHGRAIIKTLDQYFETHIRSARTRNPIRSPTEFEVGYCGLRFDYYLL